MLYDQDIPDWNSMSELTAVKYRSFAAERWAELVRHMYNDIVLVENCDNEDLTSKFLMMVDENPMLRMMWTTWIEGFTEREDGPITYKEVLQFISYLGMCEERHIEYLKGQGIFE